MVCDFFGKVQTSADEDAARRMLMTIDAAVLGAYGLFTPSEQRLIALFEGQQRQGLPFNVDTIGKESRLPQYLELHTIAPPLPPASSATCSSLLSDIDLEIDEGRRELAALRRLSGTGDIRIAARMQYVRDVLRILEARAADIGIPDVHATV